MQYTIVGDTENYGTCLVCVVNGDLSRAKKVLHRMINNPDRNDLVLIEGHTNLRINGVEDSKAWWNDPALAN